MAWNLDSDRPIYAQLLERIQRERGISYLFIAHDLGAVKHISNRIGAMYLGSLVERGEYFSGEEELKKTIENVCFNNVNEFFGFNVKV